MGRQTIYTPEIADKIIAGLEIGTPLEVICRAPDMPCSRTVSVWRKNDAEFDAEVTRARDTGFSALAHEVLTIADTPVIGERVKIAALGQEVTREDMLGHRKLQIEARLKLLACWDPKRYGPKVDLTHGGNVGLTLSILQDDASL